MLRRHLPTLAAAAALTVAAFAAAPVSAAAATTCRSGDTVHRERDGVRLFLLPASERLFACRKGGGRPVFLMYYSGTYTTIEVGARRGTVLPFIATSSGEGGGCAAEAGWFDTRTGRRGVGDAFLSDVCPELLDLAVAKDRTTAVVANVLDEPGDAVVSLHAPNGSRRLKQGLGRAFVRGKYVKGSLRLTGSAITWRDGDGARSVPRTGEPNDCTAGRTKLAIGTVRIFEAFDRAKTTATLRWCSATTTTPRALPKHATFGGVVAALRPSPEVDGRVAFDGAGIAGIADGVAGTVRALTLSSSKPFERTALGPAGELVAAYEPPSSRREGGVVVLVPGTDPTTFAASRLIATIRDDLDEKAPFAVADGAVTFTTKSGTRTVPLTGEPAATCTAGTTISTRDGVRLFEVLDVAAGTRSLLVCFAGGATPVTLVTQPVARELQAFLFGLRAGSAVVLLPHDKGADEFVTAGPDGTVRRGSALPEDRSVEYRDVAVAPDGALAYLLEGARLEAYVLTPVAGGLATARKVATRSGGYKARSLSIDETKLAWTTKAGATVTVSRPAP